VTKLFNFDELREGLYRRFKDDDVFELRLMGAVTENDSTRRNYSGYFSVVDFDAVQKHLLSIKNYEHLWGSNAPVKEETRKRADGLFRSGAGIHSGNNDAKKIKSIFIDFDVVKPEKHKNNCSSDQEKAQAWPSVEECKSLLKKYNFPEPSEISDSGNGYHVLYKCDLPVSYSGLIKRFLKILKYHLANDHVKIDESVHNPGRMIRLPGTLNQRGKNLPDRPHRMTGVIEENPPQDVSLEVLEAFVAANSWVEKSESSQVSNKCELSIKEIAETSGVEIRNLGNPIKSGSNLVYKCKCVICNSADYDAWITIYKDGFSYGCFHDTCDAKKGGTAKFAKKFGIPVKQIRAEEGEEILISESFRGEKYDGPATLKMPRNYKYEDGFIKSMDGKNGKDITSQAVYVSATLEDVETEEEYVQIAYTRNSKWRYRVVKKRSIVDRQKIIELADRGLSVGSDNATALIGYLRSFHIENENRMKLARSSSRMGWQEVDGEMGFLWGEKYIGKDSVISNEVMSNQSARHWPDNSIFFQAASSGETQLVKTLTSDGTLDGWRSTMQWCCEHPNLLSMILGSFCSPLLEVLNQDNFVMDYCNRTSSGKTTGLVFASSIWGNPDKSKGGSLIRSWDITPTSAERVAHARNHMPLFMDDTKAARDLAVVVNIVYKLASSQNRGRGNISGTDMDKNFRNVIISTGEESLADFSKDGGSIARVLQVSGPMFTKMGKGFSVEMQERVNEVYQNYGMAGPMFVKYIAENRNRWEEWRTLHREKMLRINTRNENILNRLAKCMATIMVCADILRESGILELDQSQVDEALDLIWTKCRENTDDSDREASALMCVEEGLLEKRDCVVVVEYNNIGDVNYRKTLADNDNSAFVRPGFEPIAKCHTNKVGRVTKLAVAIKTIKDILSRNGYNPRALINQWSEKGWLVEGKGSKTPVVNLGKKARSRCVVFNEKACEKLSLYGEEEKSLSAAITEAKEDMLMDDYGDSYNEWDTV
jgi:putative DNA primase/helicase